MMHVADLGADRLGDRAEVLDLVTACRPGVRAWMWTIDAALVDDPPGLAANSAGLYGMQGTGHGGEGARRRTGVTWSSHPR